MLPPLSIFHDQKKILRERMKGERAHAAQHRPDAAIHAAKNFLSAIEINANQTVSVYYPIGDELDTEPLVAALLEKNITIALPVVAHKKSPLIFRRYIPGDELINGAYGEMIPTKDAPEIQPDILVTPLLAFTRRGDRLGYGGGYYDRTLEALRKSSSVIAVGYAFGAQEVDALPLSPLDQPLDWVVTEREAIHP